MYNMYNIVASRNRIRRLRGETTYRLLQSQLDSFVPFRYGVSTLTVSATEWSKQNTISLNYQCRNPITRRKDHLRLHIVPMANVSQSNRYS